MCREQRQGASAYEVLEMSPSGHEEVVSLKNFSEEKHVVDSITQISPGSGAKDHLGSGEFEGHIGSKDETI